MTIRKATYRDAPAIKSLLAALGYTASLSLLIDHLERLFGTADHQAYVCEIREEVVGFVAVHYLPQLAFWGDLAVISYLSVDKASRGRGAGTALERHVTEQARQRKCERIVLYCSDAQHFCLRQGYREFPGYFGKQLGDAE